MKKSSRFVKEESEGSEMGARHPFFGHAGYFRPIRSAKIEGNHCSGERLGPANEDLARHEQMEILIACIVSLWKVKIGERIKAGFCPQTAQRHTDACFVSCMSVEDGSLGVAIRFWQNVDSHLAWHDNL